MKSGTSAGRGMITKRFSRCQTTGESGKIPSVITARLAFAFDAAAGLSCDGVPLAEIAARAGTPTYVYSAASIRSAWQRLDAAFAGVPHALHYALKANSTLAILRLLRGLGSGADANSGGEIEVALRAGFIPEDLVFTGVGKTPDELRGPCRSASKAINAESPGELERIDALARARGMRARVAVRLNPDIEAGAHPHISTGRRVNKFGVPIELGRDLYRRMAGMPGLQPVGVHVHIGSQITDLAPLRQAAEALVEFVGRPGARTASRSSTSISAAGSASRTTGRPRRRSTTTRRPCCPSSRRRASRSLLEPGRADRRAVRGAAGPRDRREGLLRRASRSSCSTPA